MAITLKATEEEHDPSVIEEVRHDGMEDFVFLANKPASLTSASAATRTDLRRNMSSEFHDDSHEFELEEFGSPSQPKKKPNTSRSPKKSATKLLLHHDEMDSSETISGDYAFVDVSH